MSKCDIKGCKIHKFLSDDVLDLLDKHNVTTWSSGATDDHYGIEFGAKNLKGFLKDYAEWVLVQRELQANASLSSELAHSNSKSEDTKYNNKPSNYTLELESKISPEPSQDTVSVEDIMHATPKGRETVMKAIENSIEVQNKMTKKAQNTLKESNNLNTSEEHIKDTSLDFIGCCGGGLARHEVCSHVKAYIKAQQAKLLQVIEDELPKKGELKGKGYFGYNKRQNESLGNQIVGAWDDAIDEVKEILKQIKERYE